MIFFGINAPKKIKSLILKADGNTPPSISGNFRFQRDSDGYFWDGAAWGSFPASINVNLPPGYYNPVTGIYGYTWTPTAYGQYSFIMILSSPHFYDVVDVEVERIQFYESEDVS